MLVANTTAQDSVSCNGLLDGSASVTAIGGNLNTRISGMLMLVVRQQIQLLI